MTSRGRPMPSPIQDKTSAMVPNASRAFISGSVLPDTTVPGERGVSDQLGPNDVFAVPQGVEHCPRADEEVHAILFEPKGTVNTGDAGGEMTSELREL